MKHDPDFDRRVLAILTRQGAIAPDDEQERFGDLIRRSIRSRKVDIRKWAKNRDPEDIIGLIQIARESGDQDEVVWRCFLAAQFARASADNDEKRIQSASRLLCGFDDTPRWTWTQISSRRASFKQWLLERRLDLRSLMFGNHRKFEAKTPKGIWKTIESFLNVADEFGRPSAIIEHKSVGPEDVFDEIFVRMSKVARFGRLGAFDFVALLIDLGLVKAEPRSCYLKGSKGPKKGALKLWGKRRISVLDGFTVELSQELGVSPLSIEDALCNWSKKKTAVEEAGMFC
jgi:hypothetical protein